jgi:hypothetical protein
MLLPKNYENSIRLVVPSEHKLILKSVMKLYEILTDALDSANSVFTFQIIFLSAFCVTTNVTTCYILLHKAVAENEINFSADNIAYIVLACIASFFLTIPIHYAVSCGNEVDKMPAIINKLLIIYQDSKLSVTLQNFSRQILHRSRVIKTPFFNVDCTLMFSVSFMIQEISFIENFLSFPDFIFNFDFFDRGFPNRGKFYKFGK